MKALAALGWLLPAALLHAAPADYRLTPTHSFVHVEWLHAGLSTLRARFDKVAGRVTLDREARRGQGRVELRLDSINTGRTELDAALRRAWGADAPTAVPIELTALRFDGDEPALALGRWRWRGADRVIELRAERFGCYSSPLLGREVCGGDFVTELEPAALGLAPDAALGLAASVRLRVQVEAVRVLEGDPP